MVAPKNQKEYELFIAKLSINKIIKEEQKDILRADSFDVVKAVFSNSSITYYNLHPYNIARHININIPKGWRATKLMYNWEFFVQDERIKDFFRNSKKRDAKKVLRRMLLTQAFLRETTYKTLLLLRLDHRYYYIVLAALLKYPPDAILDVTQLKDLSEFPNHSLDGQLFINIGPRTTLNDLKDGWKKIRELRERSYNYKGKTREREKKRLERDLYSYFFSLKGMTHNEVARKIKELGFGNFSKEEIRKAIKRAPITLP